MFNDGPPDGRAGEPQEPRAGRHWHHDHGSSQPGDAPYGPPGDVDRGGYEPAWAYEQSYGPVRPEPAWSEPVGPEPAWSEPVGPEPAWSEPDATPPGTGRGSRAQIFLLVVVLAVLVCGGGGTALYFLRRGETPTATEAAPQPSKAAPNGTPSPTTAPRAGTPAAQSSTDARFVKVGQCVKNEGAGSQPRLMIIRCAPKTYQVLARVNGATTGERDAKAKCGKVRGYTDWYFFNSELDALDFVLCLKLR